MNTCTICTYMQRNTPVEDVMTSLLLVSIAQHFGTVDLVYAGLCSKHKDTVDKAIAIYNLRKR